MAKEKVMSYEQERALDAYFKEHLPNYDVCDIERLSSHPDDYYLFIIVGKNRRTDKYAVWTSWNTTTESLNFGHYNLDSESEARAIVNEFKH